MAESQMYVTRACSLPFVISTTYPQASMAMLVNRKRPLEIGWSFCSVLNMVLPRDQLNSMGPLLCDLLLFFNKYTITLPVAGFFLATDSKIEFSIYIVNLGMQGADFMHCSTSFYVRHMSICRFWYLQEILEPNPHGYQGTSFRGIKSYMWIFIYMMGWHP